MTVYAGSSLISHLESDSHQLSVLVLNPFGQVDSLTLSFPAFSIEQIRLQPNTIVAETQVDVLSAFGE